MEIMKITYRNNSCGTFYDFNRMQINGSRLINRVTDVIRRPKKKEKNQIEHYLGSYEYGTETAF